MNVNYKDKFISLNNSVKISFNDICRDLQPLSSDVVYIGGSLIEGYLDPFGKGMGNAYSDIDIFIIRNHSDFLKTSAVYDHGIKKTLFVDHFPVGLDVEVYDREFVESIINAINLASICTTEKVANVLKKNLSTSVPWELINSFINRLHYSVCLFNEKGYCNLYNRIQFQKYLEIYGDFLVTGINGIRSDVIGNLDSHQYSVALSCMRDIMYKTMAFVLAHNNVSVDRTKWIFLKFKNLCMSISDYGELYDAALTLFQGDLVDDAKCKLAITNAMEQSENTIERTYLGAIEL